MCIRHVKGRQIVILGVFVAYLKKNRWKKFLASAFLLLVLGSLISACGGGDEKSDSDSAPAATVSAAASTVPTSQSSRHGNRQNS